MQAVVPKQRAFILPMGNEAVTRSHVCRTVCRRCERRMIEAQADSLYLQFINRLSDYLFVLSRFLSYQSDEPEYMWKN
jgi:cob(I)alamin adenosyltransferase